jgi:hypothetical protein
MWVWVVVAVAVVAVAVLYRRSVQKAARSGRQLRGNGDFIRFRREVRRDQQAWFSQNLMGDTPPRRSMGDDQRH